MIDNNNLVNDEDIKNFLERLKEKTVKSDRETFIQQNQWIVYNLEGDQYIQYCSILADLTEEERQLIDREEDVLLDYYYEEAINMGLNSMEALEYAKHNLREQEKSKEEKQLDEIKNIETTESVLNAEQSKEITEKISVKDKWIRLAGMRSFYNKTPAKIMFYCLVGQVLKDVRFTRGTGEQFNLKCSMFMIQDSRSGKGKLTNVFSDLADKLNLPYANFKGGESDAVLLRHFGYKKDVRQGYDFDQQIPGELEKYDFYIYREADCLISGGSYRADTAKYYLHILEDEPVPKKLEKWSGHETLTYGKGSLIATSRPIVSINTFVVQSGLMQRCLCYMRKLTNDERKLMGEKDSLLSVSNDSNDIKKKYDDLLLEICNDLINIKKWAAENEIKINGQNEINSYINRRRNELETRINEQLVDMMYANIARTFLGGWNIYIIKLMYQNAILRKSNFVEMQDAISAIDLIETCYDQLESWLQDNIAPDSRIQRQTFNFFNFIKKIISMTQKKGSIVSVKFIVKKLSRNRLHPVSDKKALSVVKSMSETNNSPFEIYDIDGKKYIRLREKSVDLDEK